jgi:hypothetical protein
MLKEVVYIDMFGRDNKGVDVRVRTVDSQSIAAKCEDLPSSIINGGSGQIFLFPYPANELFGNLLQVFENSDPATCEPNAVVSGQSFELPVFGPFRTLEIVLTF